MVKLSITKVRGLTLVLVLCLLTSCQGRAGETSLKTSEPKVQDSAATLAMGTESPVSVKEYKEVLTRYLVSKEPVAVFKIPGKPEGAVETLKFGDFVSIFAEHSFSNGELWYQIHTSYTDDSKGFIAAKDLQLSSLQPIEELLVGYWDFESSEYLDTLTVANELEGIPPYFEFKADKTMLYAEYADTSTGTWGYVAATKTLITKTELFGTVEYHVDDIHENLLSLSRKTGKTSSQVSTFRRLPTAKF